MTCRTLAPVEPAGKKRLANRRRIFRHEAKSILRSQELLNRSWIFTRAEAWGGEMSMISVTNLCLSLSWVSRLVFSYDIQFLSQA